MSEREFSRQLCDLREVAARLNEQSDSLIKLVEKFQETLRQLSLGLDVWIPLQSEDSPFTPTVGIKVPVPVKIETSLGYARGEDGWALYLKRIAYRSTTVPASLEIAQQGARSSRSTSGSSSSMPHAQSAWRPLMRSRSCSKR